MGINLPQPREPYIPHVPVDIKKKNPEVYEYLRMLRQGVYQTVLGLYDNDNTINTAVNSGTSGTFTISSGGSIVVTSGVVITVTS